MAFCDVEKGWDGEVGGEGVTGEWKRRVYPWFAAAAAAASRALAHARVTKMTLEE